MLPLPAKERFTDLEKLDLGKFSYDGLVLGSRHFLLLPLPPRFKSGQTRLKKIV